MVLIDFNVKFSSPLFCLKIGFLGYGQDLKVVFSKLVQFEIYLVSKLEALYKSGTNTIAHSHGNSSPGNMQMQWLAPKL